MNVWPFGFYFFSRPVSAKGPASRIPTDLKFFNSFLFFRIMKEVSTITRQNPTRRQAEVRSFIQRVNSCPEASAHLTAWGIGLSDQAIRIDSRILPPERLYFGERFANSFTYANTRIRDNPVLG